MIKLRAGSTIEGCNFSALSSILYRLINFQCIATVVALRFSIMHQRQSMLFVVETIIYAIFISAGNWMPHHGRREELLGRQQQKCRLQNMLVWAIHRTKKLYTSSKQIFFLPATHPINHSFISIESTYS